LKCRTIEHTADHGIEVEADSVEELFEGAASGMFSIIVNSSTVSARESRTIAIEADDLEELMFKWLNELLYVLAAEELLLSRFEVKRVEGLRLEAVVVGEPVDPARHRLGEIKAATYHQMLVERRNGSWFARVIFDV
jgi:SHS2 domain-containing protein